MFDWITRTISSLGYAGIVLFMFLENVFPPIPSELIMPLAGYLTSQDQLSFVGVVLAGTLGSVIGALPLYYLGRYTSEERLKAWADRYGHWLATGHEDVEQARSWFDRHGGATVLFCRLIPGVRSLISIPAGAAQMNLPLFLFYSTIGAAVWTAVLAYLGRVLGENFDQVDRFLGPATYVVLGGIVLAFVVRVWRRRRQTGDAKR